MIQVIQKCARGRGSGRVLLRLIRLRVRFATATESDPRRTRFSRANIPDSAICENRVDRGQVLVEAESMLTIRDPLPARNCQGLHRRDFLRIGALGLGTFTLADLFKLGAASSDNQDSGCFPVPPRRTAAARDWIRRWMQPMRSAALSAT
jgi:hypothetical protein